MPEQTAIRVVLADDHPVFRHGVADLLASAGDFDVVAAVDNGTAAVRAVIDLVPDVAILDLAMPEMNGVAVIRKLVEGKCPTRSLILSVYESRVYVEQAFEAGACGYVLKRSAFNNIAQAVRAVRAGGTYFDPSLSGHVGGPGRVHFDQSTRDASAPLAERERDILRFVAYGFTSKEIASRLATTPKAVEAHKARACSRLGIGSRAQVVQFAILQGWLQGELADRC